MTGKEILELIAGLGWAVSNFIGYGRLLQKVDDIKDCLSGKGGLVERVERLEESHAQREFSAASGR